MPIVKRLPHCLGLLLPSIDRRGRPLPSRVRNRTRRVVDDWFAGAFSGSTSDRMQIRPRLHGRWSSGSGVTVEEVEEVWAFCSGAELKKHRQSLVHLAERVCALADQDAIAILVDSGMEIVVGEES